MSAFLRVDRLLVTRGVHVMYDEIFHAGVNIVHGSNGSGKSTIADFLFFGLGGDLREWKESASRAETVFVEIFTPQGSLTLRRTISEDGGRPMDIFFGTMTAALDAATDRWQRLPYRRPDHGFSFSQVLFKAIGLPEAISDGASNLTMHQILRLLYVDQLTPVQRIFRVESFDTWQTRQAIGDLLAGIGGYTLFDKQLILRETEKKFEQAATAYRSLVAVASGYGENILADHIEAAIRKITEERAVLLSAIDDLVSSPEVTVDREEIKRLRAGSLKEFNSARRTVNQLDDKIETLDYELSDAEKFIRHLKASLEDFDAASVTFFALGHMDFEYCPSCFARVEEKALGNCQLFDTPRVEEGDDSRTLAVRLDLQMQLKESEALQVERKAELAQMKSDLRVARTALRRATETLELSRTGTVTGRETFVAEISRKIGFIDSQLESFQKRLELANQIRAAAEAKDDLNARVARLREEIEAITRSQEKRKRTAYTAISTEAKALLDDDLDEHSDFGDVTHVDFDFSGDWVAINGEKNRAGSASGMVILKNSFAAAMLAASLRDPKFALPRWMLFDNIEDKGMVQERSWNFQKLLVKLSRSSQTPHQIIFTTSKIAPELDTSEFVIGRKYTRAARSLN